jgi:hypothetical protein
MGFYEFYILLTVHPEAVLDITTNLTHFFTFFNVFISLPQHVSSDKRSSSGGNNCIDTSSGIPYRPGDCPTCWSGGVSSWPARRTVTLSVCYTRGCVDTIGPSWWWALVAWNMLRWKNKYIEKSEKSASSWLKTHNCLRMHGQQNIKYWLKFTITNKFIECKRSYCK